MAKDKLTEYDSTASNNTVVGDVNIAENCPPSGINNAIREVMSHLKDYVSGTGSQGLTLGGNLVIPDAGTVGSASDTDAITIASDGKVTLAEIATAAKGVAFPATQVASANANTLDDYEEGTFTPTISGSTSGTGTLSSANGRYTKIGRMVFCELSFTISNKGTISGTIVIGGFPFTCGFFGYQGAVRNQGLGTDNTETVTFEMQKDTATGRFLFGSASSSNRIITDSDATNNDFLAIGITYST